MKNEDYEYNEKDIRKIKWIKKMSRKQFSNINTGTKIHKSNKKKEKYNNYCDEYDF